jgi:DNA-binding NarL/FixJ family response regulator
MKMLAPERPSGSPPAMGRLESVGDRDWLMVTVNGKVPDGLAAQAERYPVVAMLTDPTPHVLRELLAMGAHAVVDARGGIDPTRLRVAVGLAAEHGVHVDPRLQHMVLQRMRGDRRLTERQQQVLELYAKGLQQGEIARRLRIELGTVGDHYRAIRERLEVASMADAVEVAREGGLL